MPSGVYIKTKEHREKLSICNKGKHLSDETRMKMSLSFRGKVVSKETREKIRKSLEGIPHSEERINKMKESLRGRHHSNETKKRMRESRIDYMISGKIPNKNTSIELKIENELKNSNLEYKSQVPICKRGVVDFFIPKYNIIIECDGLFWHNLLEKRQKDATKDLVWTMNDYKVFRFWEDEIHKSPKECINKVLKYIKKVSKLRS